MASAISRFSALQCRGVIGRLLDRVGIEGYGGERGEADRVPGVRREDHAARARTELLALSVVSYAIRGREGARTAATLIRRVAYVSYLLLRGYRR